MRTSRSTSSASSRAASPSADARLPSCSSTSGGFHIATWRSAWGAPSRSTSSISRPVSALAELARVGDRGARQHEARLGAVGARQPPQPAQHVRHVRAEHAAVDVRLVDDDPGQVRQHVAPRAVVGQHAHVEHVRVGEDQVGALADRAPLLARRVAVVDRVAQEAAAPSSGRQLARLVLRERLGRVEVERARRGVGRERVEHRQVERQRLAAGGAGGDDRVAAPGALERVGLVRPERLDPGVRRAPPAAPGGGRRAAGWRPPGGGARGWSRRPRPRPPSRAASPRGRPNGRGSRLAIVRAP